MAAWVMGVSSSNSPAMGVLSNLQKNKEGQKSLLSQRGEFLVACIRWQGGTGRVDDAKRLGKAASTRDLLPDISKMMLVSLMSTILAPN
jgi:hypothetical protein